MLTIRHFMAARYLRDKVLLNVIVCEHAGELPWIKLEQEEAEVKAHLAALREIERETARS